MIGIECAFVGRMGQPPSIRESRNGKPWASFTVGVGEGDSLQWVRVAAFGDMATAAASLEKGTSVYVEGRIRLDAWQKDGQERHGLSVAASCVTPLGQIGKRRPRRDKASEDKRHWAAPPIKDRDRWMRPSRCEARI